MFLASIEAYNDAILLSSQFLQNVSEVSSGSVSATTKVVTRGSVATTSQ